MATSHWQQLVHMMAIMGYVSLPPAGALQCSASNSWRMAQCPPPPHHARMHARAHARKRASTHTCTHVIPATCDPLPSQHMYVLHTRLSWHARLAGQVAPDGLQHSTGSRCSSHCGCQRTERARDACILRRPGGIHASATPMAKQALPTHTPAANTPVAPLAASNNESTSNQILIQTQPLPHIRCQSPVATCAGPGTARPSGSAIQQTQTQAQKHGMPCVFNPTHTPQCSNHCKHAHAHMLCYPADGSSWLPADQCLDTNINYQQATKCTTHQPPASTCWQQQVQPQRGLLRAIEFLPCQAEQFQHNTVSLAVVLLQQE